MRINSAWCSENGRRNYITHPKIQHVDINIADPKKEGNSEIHTKHNSVDRSVPHLGSNSGLEENYKSWRKRQRTGEGESNTSAT
jgi:hypothetical protein